MPMSPEEIKKELEDRDISMSAVGRRLRPGVSRVSVARVVNQVPGSMSARIQRAVARAIGKEPEEVFGAGALQSAIFNSANFSSIATDAKGVIQIFNVGAERMLGYTAAEVMNKITPAD
ncbi:MAG TPA: PAS domain S-box protein, partial [Gemmatimonadaceae bacterium]|nr:PAS domain S-box protein [Gemmatimonadaceae bacterium]